MRRKRLPLQPPTIPIREDRLFVALQRAVLKPKARDVRENAWILETTWRLVNKIFSARQDPARDQSLIQRLGRAIAESLKGYQRRRAEELGEKVESLLGLDPPLHQEAWHRIKWWYWVAVYHTPPPARVTLECIRQSGWTSTATCHPWGRISPYPLSPSRWMTRYLRRTRLSGQ